MCIGGGSSRAKFTWHLVCECACRDIFLSSLCLFYSVKHIFHFFWLLNFFFFLLSLSPVFSPLVCLVKRHSIILLFFHFKPAFILFYELFSIFFYLFFQPVCILLNEISVDLLTFFLKMLCSCVHRRRLFVCETHLAFRM